MSKRPKEKEVDITEHWDGPATVKIRRLTFGETQDLQDEAMDAAIKADKHNPRPRIGVVRVMVLLKTIVAAPFSVTPEGIRNLDPDLADFLTKEVDALNALSPKASTSSEIPPSQRRT